MRKVSLRNCILRKQGEICVLRKRWAGCQGLESVGRSAHVDKPDERVQTSFKASDGLIASARLAGAMHARRHAESMIAEVTA